MSAIMNGLALHGGFIPYAGTFLVFSDYARNAVRMAALMKFAQHIRLHPRLHRSWRGRPNPPTRGARRQSSIDTRRVGVAAVRWCRKCGGVENGNRASVRLRPACCLPARPCLISKDRRGKSRTFSGVDIFCWIRPRSPRRSLLPPARRWRSQSGRPRRSPAGCVWCPCRAPTYSTVRTRRTERKYCLPPLPGAWQSKLELPTTGTSTSDLAERSLQ